MNNSQIKPSQYKINFTGNFHGILRTSGSLHNYPANGVSTCPYADRFLMKNIKKVLESKHSSSVNIVLDETSGEKMILFIAEPKNVKKIIPRIIQIFQGNLLNLTDKTFWKILKNKNTETIQYSLSKVDLNKMVQYFNEPRTIYEKSIAWSEDRKILNKVSTFKKLLEGLLNTKESKNWLEDFFTL